MTEKYWIGTSWKMNKNRAEALEYAATLKQEDGESSASIQRFVIPPFPYIHDVKETLAGTSVKVGAQNMHWHDNGAWTGEVSPTMLTDCKLDMVELGHSERREHFGETDETVGLKVAAALRHSLTPLVCVGETKAQLDANETQAVLRAQVEGALSGVKDSISSDHTVLFAYEPVWAIGDSGTPASADYANTQHKLIKQIALETTGFQSACLYGGSVNLSNCEALVQCDAIDGLFIGRAAWNVEDYLTLLGKCERVLQL